MIGFGVRQTGRDDGMEGVSEKRFEELEARVRRLEEGFSKDDRVSTSLKKISVKEFVLQKRPKDDVQKTLVVGYYLEKVTGLNSFNVRDLESAFRSAKEPVLENINYKIIRNIEKGYIMEDKEKRDKLKAWTITNTGERFIMEGFDGE